MKGSVAVGLRIDEDPVSNVLKWILLMVAVACFGDYAFDNTGGHFHGNQP
jgi:hypothetical protein